MSSKAQRVTALTLASFRLNGLLLAWGDRFTAEFGLTSARWQMLGAIAMAERPLTAPQLAANMGVSRQGALKQLNLLAEEALVVTAPNPMHRRSPLYLLTAQGRQVYGRIDAQWNQVARALAGRLQADDLDAVLATLAQVSGFFEQALEKGDET